MILYVCYYIRVYVYARVCARFYSFSKKMNGEFSFRLKYNEREIHRGIYTKLHPKQQK